MDKPTNDAKRILVQTRTHLVPGNDYHEKCRLMKNLICQYHWNRDFNPAHDRWYISGATFGYPNRRCYFLVDYGQSTDDVPVLWYRWNGEVLLEFLFLFSNFIIRISSFSSNLVLEFLVL